MNRTFVTWFSVMGTIGVLFGIVYAFFGLGILPVSSDVLVPWGDGVYGSTFIGFSIAILFVGRHAFRRNDVELMKALAAGIFAWLIVEAAFSVYYRVFFNVAVDVALMALFGYPLVKGVHASQSQKTH